MNGPPLLRGRSCQYDLQRGIDRQRALQQLQAVHPGHLQVGDYHPYVLGAKDPQRLLPRGCARARYPFLEHEGGKDLDHGRLVVHDEDLGSHPANYRADMGRRNVNLQPRGRRLDTTIFPPWASAIRLAIDNPNPVPSDLVV